MEKQILLSCSHHLFLATPSIHPSVKSILFDHAVQVTNYKAELTGLKGQLLTMLDHPQEMTQQYWDFSHVAVRM